MNARATKKLVAGGALGAMLIGTVALASAASADQVGDDSNVDVSVEIESTVEPGFLAMSVAGGSASLTEGAAEADGTRVFTGTLPTVTVTDTRTAEEVPEGAAWYIMGQAIDFTEATDPTKTITAGHLGWAPTIVEGEETGLVQVGEEVRTILDEENPEVPGNNVGLVDQELFASSFSSGEDAVGTFAANAGLTLKTEPNVAAGSYSSTITLSLFEDVE